MLQLADAPRDIDAAVERNLGIVDDCPYGQGLTCIRNNDCMQLAPVWCVVFPLYGGWHKVEYHHVRKRRANPHPAHKLPPGYLTTLMLVATSLKLAGTLPLVSKVTELPL